MKKRSLLSLVLSLTLGVSLALPVSAASSDVALQAVNAFEKIAAAPPSSTMTYPYAGHFYLDFDQNGVPELAMVYGPESDWTSPSGMSVELWYYDGAAPQRVTDGFPDAMFGGYMESSLTSSVGASGGTGGALVRFSDGTYGMKSWDYGSYSSGQVLCAAFRDGRLSPTSDQGTEIYRLFSDEAIPGVYQYFAQPVPSLPTAYASTQTVLVDGSPVEFQCYALKDERGNLTNYVKLRDVASVLNGTAVQFDVGWDGAVNIKTGSAYTPNGSEMSTPFSGDRPYAAPTAPTNINGAPADLEAIVLTDDRGGAYTYYKLRDLGAALGFVVDWSAETGITLATH